MHSINCFLVWLSVLLFSVFATDKWSNWKEWTSCSRTCGAGVSYQIRTCLNSTNGVGTTCKGEKRRNRLCNIQDCPNDAIDFRAVQCAERNSKKFKGKLFKWVPVTTGPFKCELVCMPKGERFLVKFADKVADGTRCDKKSLDVCIDGKCEHVGCDLQLNSSARFDKCRECNGNNKKCKPVRGKFELKEFDSDYIEMLHIPARTTSITVKEEGSPRNYLALKNYKGDYILNGDWIIGRSGSYKLNGHYAVYKRSSKENSIKIDGPIDAPITIETLALDGPVNFTYEYYIPNELSNGIPQTSYSWDIKSRGDCSVSCAGGIRKRKVVCVASNDGRVVSGLLCDEKDRPSDIEDCNTQPCPSRWFIGEWSACSKTCGVGDRVRRVHCIQEVKNGQIEMMPFSDCKGDVPAKFEKCSVQKTCPEWKTDSWSECSKSCGPGFRTRAVQCVGISDLETNSLEEASCDMTIKPVLREPCDLGSCNLTWTTGPWSQCSAHCGKGMRNRQVTCQNSKSRVYPDGYCDKTFKPQSTEDCLVSGPCLPMWYATQWSRCSRDCGYGIQMRMVYCAEKVGDNIRIISNSNCKVKDKPMKMRKCHQFKPCISQYFVLPWKACSASCGTGLRFRKVRCYADSRIDYSEQTCQHLKKPVSVELCNRNACPGSVRVVASRTESPSTTEKIVPITTEHKERIATTVSTTREQTTAKPTTALRTTQPPTTAAATTRQRTEKPAPRPIPAIIINFQGPEIIDEGGTVDYYCNAMGKPEPEIKWTFNGDEIEKYKDRFLLLSSKTHLVITDIKSSDNGLLACEARNNGGVDTKSVNIQVATSPLVVITPTVANLKEGNSFFMTCDVTAFPIPSVIWRKNGRRFYGDSSRVGVSESMVRFNKLLPADTGTYECYAENSSGSDQKSMSLNVEPDTKEEVCVDDPERANCVIIKQVNLCGHPIYAAACCKTCSSK